MSTFLERRTAQTGAKPPAPAATHHHVTIDYGRDGYDPTLSLTCTAPANAGCRAEWSCDCEEFTWAEPKDGLPVHTVYDPESDTEVQHVGTYGEGCNLRDWFEGSDEMMRGAVTVPVRAEWDGGGYEFILSPPAGVEGVLRANAAKGGA